MYDVSLPARACLRAGTRVVAAWAVDTTGVPATDRADALLLTPGGGRIGSLLAGAADSQIAGATVAEGGSLATLEISDLEAQAHGLARGGTARCLLVPGDRLPAELWDLLDDRRPVALLSRLDGDRVVETGLLSAAEVEALDEATRRLWARGESGAVVTDDAVVSVFAPTTTLVLVGSGPMVEAMATQAQLLGWKVAVGRDAATAAGLLAGLSELDLAIVAAHDIELAGTALEAAFGSDVGYLAALGSREMQQLRSDWLTMRGVADQSRLHSPAGLDIGASSPAEVAVSVIAEALAVRSGRPGGSLGQGNA